MRCMDRNKSKLWYALYLGNEEIIDENGNRTGQYAPSYGKPKSLKANISAAKGDASTRQFGEDESYDKVIVHCNPKLEIDEYSVLWIDRMPVRDRTGNLALDEDGNEITPHDYIVKRVARSINSVSIAISKVNVRG